MTPDRLAPAPPVPALRRPSRAPRRARSVVPTRYEHALDAAGGLATVMAWASRHARQAVDPRDERERTVVDVSAGVAGPALTAWVLWLMRQAQRDGVRRLYFLSRDGQILLDIARRLERTLKTGLDLRYLYGSRRAFYLAGNPERTLADAARQEVCTADELAAALGLPVERLTALAPGLGRAAGRPPDPREWSRLVAELRGDAFAAAVAESAAATRQALLAYLDQEDWNDGTPSALVDVGWRGTSARALADALPATYPMPERLYYFGLLEDAHEKAGPDLAPLMAAWFFDAARGTGRLPYMRGTISLVELFCSGDHGPVLGFASRDGVAGPVFGGERSAAAPWGLDLVRRTVSAFADAVAAALANDEADPEADVRAAVDGVLRAFWLRPTPAEARHWGSFPVECSFSSALSYPLAEPLGARSLVRLLRRGGLRPRASWGEGTAALSAWPIRAALEAGWWLRDRLRARAPDAINSNPHIFLDRSGATKG